MPGSKLALAILLLAGLGPARAADYVSVADTAVLYDGPSLKAKKVFVASRHLPLERVVVLEGWVKVRDGSGGLAWIENRFLSSKRFVVVTAELAAVRQAPDEKSATLMQAKQQVALEWLENAGAGWIKVRHQDGAAGYVRAAEVWGG